MAEEETYRELLERKPLEELQRLIVENGIRSAEQVPADRDDLITELVVANDEAEREAERKAQEERQHRQKLAEEEMRKSAEDQKRAEKKAQEELEPAHRGALEELEQAQQKARQELEASLKATEESEKKGREESQLSRKKEQEELEHNLKEAEKREHVLREEVEQSNKTAEEERRRCKEARERKENDARAELELTQRKEQEDLLRTQRKARLQLEEKLQAEAEEERKAHEEPEKHRRLLLEELEQRLQIAKDDVDKNSTELQRSQQAAQEQERKALDDLLTRERAAREELTQKHKKALQELEQAQKSEHVELAQTIKAALEAERKAQEELEATARKNLEDLRRSPNAETLMSFNVKDLKLMLAVSGFSPTMPPVEKQEFITALLAAVAPAQPDTKPADQPGESAQPAESTPPAPFSAGDRVRITGLKGQQELNGRLATIIEEQGQRLLVRIDCSTDKKSIKPANLEMLNLPVPLPKYKSMCITGSWDEWKMHSMKWDEEFRCYHFKLELGKAARENFVILVDGSRTACLHPDVPDACPYFDYRLCGPDSAGRGQSWTIGRHPLDKGEKGACYQVQLALNEDGSAEAVDWVRLPAGHNAASAALPKQRKPTRRPDKPWPIRLPRYDSVSIAGSWCDWSVRAMSWNSFLQCYYCKFRWKCTEQVSFEAFQILLDGDWKRRLHPEMQDAFPDADCEICGPHDEEAHDLNWAICGGKKGEFYEIRLMLSDSGYAVSIDTMKITEAEFADR
eukprot:gnl/TRDRNA2_/TRDRNA2_162899_c0_seq1.p1 gnl/TRDRNA2_/TRDRNA2_162899_c0~~gnl/TRDRNA2_/TRDRNA2_162899_c0_seq1.p1  ORF type:complete len:746 (-),score=192.78 gnl/TRDRNA2_/TRDRNA2_162899_c0_seq1:111-2348(-)